MTHCTGCDKAIGTIDAPMSCDEDLGPLCLACSYKELPDHFASPETEVRKWILYGEASAVAQQWQRDQMPEFITG